LVGLGVVWGPIVLCMHTKFEVSSFSRSVDMRVITGRIQASPTYRTTDITTGLHIAYIGGRRHKNAKQQPSRNYIRRHIQDRPLLQLEAP